MKPYSMRSIPVALCAVVFALSGCKKQTETFNSTAADPMANALAHAKPVELPPMLKTSKSYRCKDNSLVFIDFMTDNKTAHFRAKKDGEMIILKAPEAGKPYVSPDGKIKVTGGGDNVELTMGRKTQACKA